jgi:hypothetical protein
MLIFFVITKSRRSQKKVAMPFPPFNSSPSMKLFYNHYVVNNNTTNNDNIFKKKNSLAYILLYYSLHNSNSMRSTSTEAFMRLCNDAMVASELGKQETIRAMRQFHKLVLLFPNENDELSNKIINSYGKNRREIVDEYYCKKKPIDIVRYNRLNYLATWNTYKTIINKSNQELINLLENHEISQKYDPVERIDFINYVLTYNEELKKELVMLGAAPADVMLVASAVTFETNHVVGKSKDGIEGSVGAL